MKKLSRNEIIGITVAFIVTFSFLFFGQTIFRYTALNGGSEFNSGDQGVSEDYETVVDPEYIPE